MGYTVLRGSFVIRYPDLPRQGPQPDGDTVKSNRTPPPWWTPCRGAPAVRRRSTPAGWQ